MSNLERYFDRFRKDIVGIDQYFKTPFGVKKIAYADWIASGRLYRPIEQKLLNEFGPFIGNTHTETSETGTRMTYAYQYSHELIKANVNADKNDVIITAGFGMTAVVNKFQRILGLKAKRQLTSLEKENNEKPVVFVSHMEHHSNQTSWYETNADVVVLKPGDDMLIDTNLLKEELKKYKDREFKIGAFTACSNVTGIRTPIHELAKIMHENGGVIFVDYAASAPYDDINMHPENPLEKLDAVLFSPHKFLGGPGSSGVLIFDASMYKTEVPDNPGGGTVDWTNPWGKYKYVDNIEVREDGGTPGFLQSMKTALTFQLKNQMTVEAIHERENEQLTLLFNELDKIPEVKILANEHRERLGVVSFYIEEIHYNLLVKLLNDLYGIQTRGGCACAGTYGHYLLHVSYEYSQEITDMINLGDMSEKPGWVRYSLHPTTSTDEILLFVAALKDIIANFKRYSKDYQHIQRKNLYVHKNELLNYSQTPEWFKL